VGVEGSGARSVPKNNGRLRRVGTDRDVLSAGGSGGTGGARAATTVSLGGGARITGTGSRPISDSVALGEASNGTGAAPMDACDWAGVGGDVTLGSLASSLCISEGGLGDGSGGVVPKDPRLAICSNCVAISGTSGSSKTKPARVRVRILATRGVCDTASQITKNVMQPNVARSA
jgi:hypothetical protein